MSLRILWWWNDITLHFKPMMNTFLSYTCFNKKKNPNFHLLNVNACVNMCGQMIQLLSTALFSKVDSKILRQTKYKDIFLWKEKHHWSIMHKKMSVDSILRCFVFFPVDWIEIGYYKLCGLARDIEIDKGQMACLFPSFSRRVLRFACFLSYLVRADCK